MILEQSLSAIQKELTDDGINKYVMSTITDNIYEMQEEE